ncbi:MAG: Rieske 2Fe-2S domain-containing protein [Myxococcota bacterium]|nr:Rieske 2Fe-2S domain-containing protein [Myxococcota bacterium]
MDKDVVPGIPNGWYAVAWGSDLAPGEVRRIYYFEEEMVLFRTRTGRARVLSAFCPHLGAHLAEGGRVVGESIRCPFHAWQYDGANGKCVEIPYCERIPTNARVRAWEVVERNGMIFVWHHAEQKPSDWEVPEIAQFSDPEWSEARTFEIEVPIHMQDMAENNLDPVHFEVVHTSPKVPETEIEFAEDGRFMHAVSYSEEETPFGTFKMSLLRDSWCLGMSSVESSGIPGVGLYMFSSTSPIDRHNTVSRWAMTATRNRVDTAGEDWFKGITSGVDDDLRIWGNKIHRPNPVFCEADKLLVEFRRWVQQFYSEPVN